MTNKEAIKYLIQPFATSTKSYNEYLKQKEAYDLAIKALEVYDEMQKWLKPCYTCSYRPDRTYNDFNCADCYHYDNYKQIKEDTCEY